MTALNIEVKVSEPVWGEEFADTLKALPEPVARAFLHIFEHLLSKPVIEYPEGSYVTADGTRHGGIALRIVGTTELLAAARAAA